jgi:PLP dependent protein
MTDEELIAELRKRLDAVETRIVAACQRAGRSRQEVTLVAVTKTVGNRVAGLLPGLGVADLGESRPQELWRKSQAIAGVRWHMIGHLQRNKVEETIPLCHLTHSIDSPRLFDEVVRMATKLQLRPKILLQVNASREEQKHGFDFEELPELVPLVQKSPVEVIGLMAMAAYSDDPESARPAFRELREARDTLRQSLPDVTQLSMGMSGDYEVAIEEGATHIRIGSTLFDGLDGV